MGPEIYEVLKRPQAASGMMFGAAIGRIELITFSQVWFRSRQLVHSGYCSGRTTLNVVSFVPEAAFGLANDQFCGQKNMMCKSGCRPHMV